MTLTQVHDLVNNATREILGESALLTVDLSNVVDIGTAIFNANAVDNYVRSLINHIGKVVFVNRKYTGSLPSMLMDGWEYGSVMEKVSVKLPEAQENESWELTDGATYEQDIFTKPSVTARFYNKKVTFEIPISITERQVKESFSNATQLNGFISTIYTAVDNAMTVKIDSLAMRTLGNMIAETYHDDIGVSTPSATTGTKAVNLLKLYNDATGNSVTVDEITTDPDFIRYAAYVLKTYATRMRKISTLFNIAGEERFTPQESLHIAMLSDFKSASDVYLQSETFHNELSALPTAEDVPYWQGSGTSYDFDDISTVKVVTASGDTVTASGVLAVMYDRNSCGICNADRRTTTAYNAKGEFFNSWYKYDAMYFNDPSENFVVFFVA